MCFSAGQKFFNALLVSLTSHLEGMHHQSLNVEYVSCNNSGVIFVQHGSCDDSARHSLCGWGTGSLGDVYIYEAPSVFSTCWKAVAVFLPESIRSRIHYINQKTGWGPHSHLLEVGASLGLQTDDACLSMRVCQRPVRVPCV